MSWLSSSLGVTIPDGAVTFDGAGIITLGLNALYLGYDALKAGVIAGLGAKGVKDAATVVSWLETGALAGFTLLQTIRSKGLAGAWDALTQQVGDSLGAALEGAKAAVLPSPPARRGDSPSSRTLPRQAPASPATTTLRWPSRPRPMAWRASPRSPSLAPPGARCMARSGVRAILNRQDERREDD